MPLTCWSPSPCTRLSRARTTTRPPPRPAPISGRHACPPPLGGRAATGRFPRSPPLGRPVRRPALPRQHRHEYAAGFPRGLPADTMTSTSESPPNPGGAHCIPAHIRQVGAGGTVTGLQTLVPRVHLPVSLAGPVPSDSAGTSRRCQGCSHPPACLRAWTALSFPALLRQHGNGVLSPPSDSMAPRGARWCNSTRRGTGPG